MTAYINCKREDTWYIVMKDNTVKVFESLLKYNSWWMNLTSEERKLIDKSYTINNAKDREKLKELKII